MILSDTSIRRRVAQGSLGIEPDPDWEAQLQPASLDLRLGFEFATFGTPPAGSSFSGVIDPGETDISELTKQWVQPPNSGYRLDPGEFVLATTFEYIRLPNDIVARVEGRSSFGRLGLIVHSTAGFIDPGFEGNITLEMTNIGRYSILLRPGTRICQLAFEALDQPSRGYSGKYQGQRGVTQSRAVLDK